MEILDLNNEEDTKTTDEMEPKKPEEKTSPVKEILSWVLTIAFAIVAAILIKNYKCKYSVRLDGEHHTDWR